MPAAQETYTRRHGLQRTYAIEYTSLHYKILLDGKVLKEIRLPIQTAAVTGSEAAWKSAVADIEYLRGMAET